MRISAILSAIALTFSCGQASAASPTSGATQFGEARALFGKRAGIKQVPASPPGIPIPYPNTSGAIQGDKKSTTGYLPRTTDSSRTSAISTGGSGGEDRRSGHTTSTLE